MSGNDSMTNDPLSGLLGAALGGQPALQDHMQNTGQSLDQILAGLSNAAPAGGNSAGGSLSDLLGSVMGGAPQPGNAPAASAGGDALSSLLGGLLGGAAAPNQATQGGDPLSALVGGLLGGGAPNAAAVGNNSFLAPIVESIAAKLGIPPPIAQTVVSFAMTQLMSGQASSLAQLLGANGSVSQKYLRDSGLVDQLTQQTGIDKKTATQSLQQVLQAFATQMGEGTPEERRQNLQDWHAG